MCIKLLSFCRMGERELKMEPISTGFHKQKRESSNFTRNSVANTAPHHLASSVIAKWPICGLHTPVHLLYPRVFCSEPQTSSWPVPKHLRVQLQKRRLCGALPCFLCLKGYCLALTLDFLIMILEEFSHDSFLLLYFIFFSSYFDFTLVLAKEFPHAFPQEEGANLTFLASVVFQRDENWPVPSQICFSAPLPQFYLDLLFPLFFFPLRPL